MLIRFRFQNFRSFRSEQTFSFSTSADRAHESTHLMQTGMKAVPRVAKVAVVFGPNGGGKSNLLIALATLRDLILRSTALSDAQFSERHMPFRFGAAALLPTEFEIDVLLDHVRYRYTMAYDARRVRSERLLVYRTGKSQRWFERRYDEAAQRDEWTPFSPNFNGPREMWRKATRPQALFLTTAAQLNSEQLAPLMGWVETCLDIVFPNELAATGRIAALIRQSSFKARVLRLLQAVDIRVEDLRVVDADAAGDRGAGGGAHHRRAAGPYNPSAEPPMIELGYVWEGNPLLWVDAAFEAAGTHRLIGLFALLLEAIERGRLLLIDEFDTSLHPLAARFLVQRINDPALPNHGAQLLLTSHNTTLMDLDFLRRDEIWLVQLDAQHASSLAPLLRSSPRKHEMIAKNYLRGRYGAIPRIEDTGSPGALHDEGGTGHPHGDLAS